jgi:hypothetical protein
MIELLAGNTWITGLGVLIFAGITTLKIYLDYRRQVAKKGSEEYAFRASQTPESIDNLAELLVQNFRTLNSFYSENLAQYRTSSLASIAIAILGFVVIIAGLFLAFFGQQVAVGTVSAAAGVISEAGALLFFRQNQAFRGQMESSLKTLVSAQYLMTSIALARDMDGESKHAEIQLINAHLRQLMNVLHGVAPDLAIPLRRPHTGAKMEP